MHKAYKKKEKQKPRLSDQLPLSSSPQTITKDNTRNTKRDPKATTPRRNN
jgi:hypothetical protein